MKKRVLFVINSLGCGGAEKSLVSLLSVMDYSRYQVDLQMFRPEGMFIELLNPNVSVLPTLPYIKYCSKECDVKFNLRYLLTRICTAVGLRLPHRVHGQPLHDAQRYWKLTERVFEPLPNKYDVAIAWGQGNPTHFVATKVVAEKKIAFVNVDYIKAGHNKYFDRPYYEKFDYIASVSSVQQQAMQEVFPDLEDQMVTIYDIRNQELIEKMAEEYIPYQKKPNTKIFVTVGRMVSPKGYDLAVGAAKYLKDNGLNFKWYFVGDGPEMKKIQSLIRQNGLQNIVVPVGAKENPYPYIKCADIYIQTSKFEGFCLTLAEARALHIPPVSTNFDAVYNQLRDGETGLIVEMNPNSIARAIGRLLADDMLQEKIVSNLKIERIGNEEEVQKLYDLMEGMEVEERTSALP